MILLTSKTTKITPTGIRMVFDSADGFSEKYEVHLEVTNGYSDEAAAFIKQVQNAVAAYEKKRLADMLNDIRNSA